MTDGSRVDIAGDEADHAVKALRLQPGEHLIVTDGFGRSADAEVLRVGPVLEVQLADVRNEPRPMLDFAVVQALPKRDRGELAVELLTEVGVNSIVPWQAARSISVWRDEKKKERGRKKWQSAARAAAKQSRRVWWPEVSAPATTTEVADLVAGSDVGVLLHESAEQPLATLEVPASGVVTIVVGPEGGLDPAEVGVLTEAGGHLARMGPTVMRTSTAGAVGAAILMAKSTRWSR